MKNRIGWCDLTFNPVWGCRNICPYCYARAIAKRFWKQRYEEEFRYHYKKYPNEVWFGDQLGGLWEFKPTWLDSKYNKKFPKKPQRIFVGSMSEIEFWREDWMLKVLNRVKWNPQHTFIFLTKHPEVYNRYFFPNNCWLGTTVTNESDIYYMHRKVLLRHNNLSFLCIEPLLGKIDLKFERYKEWGEFDWVIIGAETGNRKGKVVPNGSWVFDILDFCARTKTPIFIKDNLVKYYSEFGGYKEFPKEVGL